MFLVPTEIGRRGTISIPLVGMVQAGTTGFQSPADDYLEDRIDLAKELVTNQANTFCWRVSGDSFKAAGIPDGSVVVIDNSLKPKVNNVVLVRLNDLHCLKTIARIHGKLYLTSATEGYPIIPIDEESGIEVIGVLKHCVISF